jgi:cell division protein FtsW
MARKLRSDTLLFTATMLLLVVGAAWVYSASAVASAEKFEGRTTYFLVRQLLWTAMGVACLLVTMRLDYRIYRQPRVLLGMVAVSLIGLVAVFFSPAIKGSHRWLGMSGVGVQPSEFAKLVGIIVVAAALHEWLERREDLRTTATRIGTVLGGFLLLVVVEPDYGSAIVICAVAGTMVFAAGLAYRWIAGAALIAPPLAFAVLILEPYRWRRIEAWWNPWLDRSDKGFQTVQSLLAVGTGGVWGKGFMEGVQKMFYLPEAHNDFIFAVIAEEQGLIGTTLVVAIFCVLIWRGLRVARRAPDAYGSLLATGITAMLGLQALLNMSVVLNLLPAKGIALPFVSAGGSSMLVSLFAIGILLNISQHATD